MELGPKDLAGENVVLVRRDTGAKTPVPWADVATAVPRLLKTIHVGHWRGVTGCNLLGKLETCANGSCAAC